MSGPTGPTQVEYNSLLYKKALGVPYTNPDIFPPQEAIGSSIDNVQLYQVWNQVVPTVPPAMTGPNTISYGVSFTNSGLYPYLFRYVVKLTSPLSNPGNPGLSFYYAGTDPTTAATLIDTNLLIDGIPFRQDPNGGYQFSVSYGPDYYLSLIHISEPTRPY